MKCAGMASDCTGAQVVLPPVVIGDLQQEMFAQSRAVRLARICRVYSFLGIESCALVAIVFLLLGLVAAASEKRRKILEKLEKLLETTTQQNYACGSFG